MLAGLLSASWRLGNVASLEEMSQRWQAVGNPESYLTSRRFNPTLTASETNALPPDHQAGEKSRTVRFFHARNLHNLKKQTPNHDASVGVSCGRV